MEEETPAMIFTVRRAIPVDGRTGIRRNHFDHGLHIRKRWQPLYRLLAKIKSKQLKTFRFMKKYCLHVVVPHPDGMVSQKENKPIKITIFIIS